MELISSYKELGLLSMRSFLFNFKWNIYSPDKEWSSIFMSERIYCSPSKLGSIWYQQFSFLNSAIAMLCMYVCCLQSLTPLYHCVLWFTTGCSFLIHRCDMYARDGMPCLNARQYKLPNDSYWLISNVFMHLFWLMLEWQFVTLCSLHVNRKGKKNISIVLPSLES